MAIQARILWKGGQRFVEMMWARRVGIRGRNAGSTLVLLAPPRRDGFVTLHAKDALRSPGVAKIFNLALAVSAFEAAGAEGLVSSQDGEILDFVAAGTAAIGAAVAYQRAITKKQKVGVGVEQGATGVASEAVYVPTVAGYGASQKQVHQMMFMVFTGGMGADEEKSVLPNSNALPSSNI